MTAVPTGVSTEPAGGNAARGAGSTEGARTRAAGTVTGEDVRVAAQRARDLLLSLQHGEGYWKGVLDTNVTMDAEDLLLRQFLGIRGERETAEAARWIRSQQRDDGTWANFHGGPPDVSTTVEAYIGLRLAGDSTDAPHMVAATKWIRGQGGVEATRVFTRIWLALFGLWSWDDLPVMPPELVYLPKWFPLNVYDWGCWARQTVVALTIVTALRPSRDLGLGIDELRVGAPPEPQAPATGWSGFFQRLDRALHVYERKPVRGVRRAALRRAAEWIIARQEADGCWGGIQPPWVYSLMALNAVGYDLDHPVMRKGIDGLEGFLVREETAEGVTRRLEACQSPVWDTVLAMNALSDVGVPGDDPAMTSAAGWVVDEEIRGPGDWVVRRPDTPAGGWAFEFANDNYPDTDDTAEVLLALDRADHPTRGDEVRASMGRGKAWLAGMQSRDGGWGAFDADNTRELCTKVPFSDFGAVIDPPSADVTAHIVEAFCATGYENVPDGADTVRRGVDWLLAGQEADGSWYGRWGANYVYGTGAAVPALVAAGVSTRAPAVRRAVSWLEKHQNPDGGWGESLYSYEDPRWIGRGESTASQTAWALLALLAAGENDRGGGEASETVQRGVAWLVGNQREDGGWDEPQFTGTGFPGDFYINYHLYRLVFPVSALGRYLGGAS